MQLIEISDKVATVKGTKSDGTSYTRNMQLMRIMNQDGQSVGTYKIGVPSETGVRPGLYELNEFSWDTGEWGVPVLSRDLAQTATYLAASYADYAKGGSRTSGKPSIAAE